MREKEEKEIEEQVRNEFFKKFPLKFLDEEGKQFALETAIKIAIFHKKFVNSYSGDNVSAYILSILSMQNLYSLTAIHENKESLDKINESITEINQKFDELNNKFNTLIELLSKDKV